MQQRAIGILVLAALIALVACGGGGTTSTSSPMNVRTQAGDGYVTVTWDFSGDARRFEIYRETIETAALGAQALERIDTVEDGSARSYDDTAVDASATYAYGVSADGGAVVDAGGSGVRPDPGNDLRVFFGSAVPGGATVSITSDPPGIDCEQSGGTGCEAEFASIVDVTLTAETSPGVAAVWENCDVAESGSCQVGMATNRTVTVDFFPANTLEVDVSPTGTGRVESQINLAPNPNVDCTDSCSYEYPSNLQIDLSAEPLDADHYQLAGWGGACSTFSGTTCSVTMDASKALSAQFQLIPPVIQSFTAVERRITSGETSTLSWDVTGGGDLGTGELTISIEPGEGEVGSRTGSVDVSPSVTTIYTLTASNATATVSDTRTVVVGNGALIDSFTASPAAINPGQTSTLAWTVSGTDTEESPLSLTLDPGGIDVTGMVSYPVEPNEDTTYTLMAENEFGPDSDTVEVRVGNAPTIVGFGPREPYVNPGGPTLLEWDVTGPGTISLTLDPGGRDVTGATSATVEPTETTTYTLIAESEFGDSSDTTIVNVGVGPAITAFAADPDLLATGDSTTLSWNATGDGTIRVVLEPDGIDVSEQNSISRSPNATTLYTLVATSEYGEASADEEVTVGDAPSIGSFSASDTTVTSGAPVELSWSVSGADSLILDPVGEIVTGVSGTTVNPTSDTTYTLVATNAFGTVDDSIPVDVGTAPSLSDFAAMPASITEGDFSTLSWGISGTGSITLTIDQGVGDVTEQTSELVSPPSTTEYTISAVSDFGTDSDSVTVTVEAAATTLAPTASTCDGVAVSESCLVTISLSNTVEAYEGLEFDFASSAFDLTDASTSTETSGCIVDAGSTTVVLACDTAFGTGDVASLSVQRNVASASTFETSNAFAAPDDQVKTAVNGGTLAVAAAN